MPRADFYIIDTNDPADRDRFACRYISRARDHGKRIFVYTRSAEESRALDEVLWRFRPESFIPHTIVDQAEADLADYPVLISDQAPPATEKDVLLNLSGTLPAFHDRFERIAEIFNKAEESDLKAARQAYRRYRELGYEPNHHEIEKVGGTSE